MLRGLVILIAIASRVNADPIGVAIAGEPTMQKSVQTAVEAWLAQHHYEVHADALDADTHTTLFNCLVMEDMACAHETVVKRAKVPTLVFLRVDLVGGDERQLAITGYWFVKGHEAVAEKRWCRKCDAAALAHSVDELMTFLANAGSPPPQAAAAVETSAPPSRAVPAALFTAGGAALVTSGVFFYYGHKGGNDAPLVYPDATRNGVLFAIGGAGAVIAGAVLWMRGSHATTVPTASLTGSSAAVGLVGAF